MTIRKFIEPRPFADPEAAARKLMEIADSVESVQDGRDQLAVSAGASRQPGRVQGWSRPCHRARVAMAPRERHLCEVQAGRLGAVRMTSGLRKTTLGTSCTNLL